MKTLIRFIFYSIALLFIIIIAVFSFLISTNTGLYASLHIANWMVPGKLTVKKATGTLLSNWHLKDLDYDGPEFNATLNALEINWRLMRLFSGHLVIKKAIADRLTIHHKLIKAVEKPHPPTKRSQNYTSNLPVAISIDDLSIKQLAMEKASLSNIQLKKMKLDDSNWQLDELSFEALGSQYTLSGTVDPNKNLAADITFKAKALKSKGLSGEFSVKGNWADYAWQGYTASPISILTTGHITKANAVNGQAKWQSFTLPGQHTTPIQVAAGELMLKGDINQLAFHINTALIQPAQTQINASGYFSPQHTEATVSVTPGQGRLKINFQQDRDQTHTKTMIKLNGERLDLDPYQLPLSQLNVQAKLLGSNLADLVGNLTAKGFYRNEPISLALHKSSQKLKGEASLANNRFSITGQTPFPISIRGSMPSPQLIAPVLKGLHTHINLNAKLYSATNGRAQLSIQPGSFTCPSEQPIPPLSFIGGNYTFLLTERGLHISGKLAIDKQKTLLTKVQFPHLSLRAASLRQQTILGQTSLHLNSLDFVSQLSPHIVEANGRVNAQLNISGQLANPQINGKLELRQGSFKTQTGGKPFQPVTATVTTNAHRWQLQGTIDHQGSRLTVNGSGQFTPLLKGRITVSGNHFLTMDNKEYQVYMSPDISINLSPDKTEIAGELTIPEARIQPQTFSSTVTLSDDVIFADQKGNEPGDTPFKLNLLVKMGKDVHLLIEGLSAKIIGSIRLQKLSGGELTSSGQLSVSDGKYEAYGQKLDISQGELLFAGGTITNPGINLRAIRTFDTAGQAFSGSSRLFDFGASNIQSMSFSNITTVGIQVSGRLTNPKISLFSEPGNLQQSDILSMLILGKPASQASDAGGQLLLSAITNMGLDRGTQGGQLLSQLQNKLGLEFDLNSNTVYDRQQNETSSTHSLGIKKKFSDRLSLGYNVGIYDSNSTVLTLTYLLNKFLSIQVNASDNASGMDLTYTRSKD